MNEFSPPFEIRLDWSQHQDRLTNESTPQMFVQPIVVCPVDKFQPFYTVYRYSLGFYYNLSSVDS